MEPISLEKVDLKVAQMEGSLREGIKSRAKGFLGTLTVPHGGTGLSSAPIGTMLYAAAANVYSSVTLGPNLSVSGSVLDVVGGAIIQGTNQSGVTVEAGQAVAIASGGNGFVLARANDMDTLAVGLCTAQCLAGATMTVQTSNTITVADWTNSIGAATLTVRGRYYLSPTTAGRLQVAPITGATNFRQFIGLALTTTKMVIGREGRLKL